jgi:hypothetical protein
VIVEELPRRSNFRFCHVYTIFPMQNLFADVPQVLAKGAARFTSRISVLGTEESTYDKYDRRTGSELDVTTYAAVTYDSYSRI